jgi:hypothetical protein
MNKFQMNQKISQNYKNQTQHSTSLDAPDNKLICLKTEESVKPIKLKIKSTNSFNKNNKSLTSSFDFSSNSFMKEISRKTSPDKLKDIVIKEDSFTESDTQPNKNTEFSTEKNKILISKLIILFRHQECLQQE